MCGPAFDIAQPAHIRGVGGKIAAYCQCCWWL